jgi:hypothetical protein
MKKTQEIDPNMIGPASLIVDASAVRASRKKIELFLWVLHAP